MVKIRELVSIGRLLTQRGGSSREVVNAEVTTVKTTINGGNQNMVVVNTDIHLVKDKQTNNSASIYSAKGSNQHIHAAIHV